MTHEGKVAIITGAGKGIGLAIARQLIAAGANLVLNDVHDDLAQAAEKEFTSQRCITVPGDSADPKLINEMVASATKKFGKLDIAIANAGITLFGDFFTYTRERFDQVMHVNMAGTFFLAQAAAQVMKNQKSGGSILFTSSVTGHQAHKHLAAYSMTKAAIEMLARNLVIELSQYKINVNTIAPGATVTERTKRDDAEYEKKWSAITPMGKPAHVDDIAHAALFLVRPSSLTEAGPLQVHSQTNAA
jgi:glucose 1-dehydrogenase